MPFFYVENGVFINLERTIKNINIGMCYKYFRIIYQDSYNGYQKNVKKGYFINLRSGSKYVIGREGWKCLLVNKLMYGCGALVWSQN